MACAQCRVSSPRVLGVLTAASAVGRFSVGRNASVSRVPTKTCAPTANAMSTPAMANGTTMTFLLTAWGAERNVVELVVPDELGACILNGAGNQCLNL